MNPDPYTSDDTLVFDDWSDVRQYVEDECEDGITIEELEDAAVGIDVPHDRLKGHITTVDGVAGLSCETLQEIARYLEDD
jgi:hypothetical protein